MPSNALGKLAARKVILLIAVSPAPAQAPNTPVARFHHSGVYDETRKEFLIYGGFTYDQKIQQLSDVWGWDGTWRLV